MPLENFDILQYLDDKEIEHSEFGKNVTRGWTNISCLWCEDPSNHLGINLTTKFMNCWACGTKGPATKLIREIEECSWAEANTIVEKYQDNTFEYLKQDIQIRSNHVILPKEATDVLPKLHRKYLQSRNFDPDTLVLKYDIKACYNIGDWKFRLIIPIYMDRKLVCFTSRDVTGKAESAYKHCPNEKAIIPAKECVYNIDSVKDKVLIMEGVFDVWRFGDGAVDTFGIEFTLAQINLLRKKNLKEAYILFDPEPLAMKKAEELGNILSVFIPWVEAIELEKGDPADMSNKEARKLKNELFREEGR